MGVAGSLLTDLSSRTEDVISNLAHELRQPLSAIEAIAYYLELTLPVDQQEARQHLIKLQELVEHSSTILKDAVNASRAA